MLLISKRGGLSKVENSFLISLGKNVEEKRIPYRPRLQTLEELQAGYRQEEPRSWARTEKRPAAVGEKQGDGPRGDTQGHGRTSRRNCRAHWSPGPRRSTEAVLMPEEYFISTQGTTAHRGWRAALFADHRTVQVSAFRAERPAAHTLAAGPRLPSTS